MCKFRHELHPNVRFEAIKAESAVQDPESTTQRVTSPNHKHDRHKPSSHTELFRGNLRLTSIRGSRIVPSADLPKR